MDYLAIKPIDRPIAPRKQSAKRHYGCHPYFTKRAWNIVAEYIKNFSQPGDIVLDPFCGSGVTAVEALVLRRHAIHVDICPLANFLCQQTAVASVNLFDFQEAFNQIKSACKTEIEKYNKLTEFDLENVDIPYWYPQGIKLPKNSDVGYVEELFTRRQLIALSILNHHIVCFSDPIVRSLMSYVFSCTLVKTNRTFIYSRGRAVSRGASTIFSIYRYAVPKETVELDVWEQFEMKFKRVMAAKAETNKVIRDFYRDGETFNIFHRSATELSKFIKPESVDYIYTDPPCGRNIAYLDLATMWHAWLNLEVTDADRKLEVIEGGEQNKSEKEYIESLTQSINEMFKVLKYNRWLSIVFAHKNPLYWDTILNAAEKAGFEYVATNTHSAYGQSYHKRKNPLKVLSGELVLNFRKVENPKTIAITKVGSDVVNLIKNSAEATIVNNQGASTEAIYTALIPQLLEEGMLGEVKDKLNDITPVLNESFKFDAENNVWTLKESHTIGDYIPMNKQIRFYVVDFLKRCERKRVMATFDDIVFNVMPKLTEGTQSTERTIVDELKKAAYSPDGQHWMLIKDEQLELAILPAEKNIAYLPPASQKPESELEHNEILYMLAKLGTAIDLSLYIGKKERSMLWNGDFFSRLSLPELPFKRKLEPYTKRNVEQIDCIWFDNVTMPVFAFEVEHTTDIKDAIDRFIELLKINLNMSQRIILVAPSSRRRKLAEVLTKSHYIGAPMYMENKLAYIFYKDLVRIYDRFTFQKPRREKVIAELQKYLKRLV